MTFQEHLNKMKGMLSEEYKELDFTNDLYLVNKLEDSACAIANRINNPPPTKPAERHEEADEKQEWRFHF